MDKKVMKREIMERGRGTFLNGYFLQIRRPSSRYVLHVIGPKTLSHDRELNKAQMERLVERVLDAEPDWDHFEKSEHWLGKEEGVECPKCSGSGYFTIGGKVIAGICFACLGKGFQIKHDLKRNKSYWENRLPVDYQ